jgi:hypothetical protein
VSNGRKVLGGKEMIKTKKELKELLTPEFLSTLHTAVECCNWDVDMIETMKFCNWCYNIAGQPEPFEIEEE